MTLMVTVISALRIAILSQRDSWTKEQRQTAGQAGKRRDPHSTLSSVAPWWIALPSDKPQFMGEFVEIKDK